MIVSSVDELTMERTPIKIDRSVVMISCSRKFQRPVMPPRKWFISAMHENFLNLNRFRQRT